MRVRANYALAGVGELQRERCGTVFGPVAHEGHQQQRLTPEARATHCAHARIRATNNSLHYSDQHSEDGTSDMTRKLAETARRVHEPAPSSGASTGIRFVVIGSLSSPERGPLMNVRNDTFASLSATTTVTSRRAPRRRPRPRSRRRRPLRRQPRLRARPARCATARSRAPDATRLNEIDERLIERLRLLK